MPRETSAAIGELFRGFSGYGQADAKSVYSLFKPAAERPRLDDGEPDLDERHEVGCWTHCRRKAWEVAIDSKDPVTREAVLRIKRIFDLDRSWRGKPPDDTRMITVPAGMCHTAIASAIVTAMATTTMQLEASLRDELAEIARDDFAGVPLAEALRRLIREHRINKIMARYAELRSDPQEWASYRAEASLTDAAAGDGLPAASEEYPEYHQ